MVYSIVRQIRQHLNNCIGARKEGYMRVYQGDSLPQEAIGQHYTFVEIEEDKFLEIDLPLLDELNEGTKNRLRAGVRKLKAEEDKTQAFYIRMHPRYFQTIHKVPNLRLVGEF